MRISLNGICIFSLFALMSCGTFNKNKAWPLSPQGSDASSWKVEAVSPKDLEKWRCLGVGKAFGTVGGQLCLEESESSEGVMLISPAYYGTQVVVRYQVLLLSPASVVVTLLSASDIASHQLTIPADYNGAMNFWNKERENYFFVFRNAPHGGNPYITVNPGVRVLARASQPDRALTGVYYDVEVGRDREKLWLSIDGNKLLDTKDTRSIGGGHVALRLRGTAGFKAAALIKNLKIFSK